MNRKHAEQFEIQTVETQKGFRKTAVYRGKYYSAAVPAEKLARYKAALKGASLVMALLFVGMGLMNNDGSKIFYVILPYAILSLSVFFMLVSSITFGKTKEKLTVPEYDKTVGRIKTAVIAAFISATAGAIGSLIYILSGQSSTPGWEIIFLAGYVAIAACAFLSLQIHKNIQYEQTDEKVHESTEK
ncbi:MAG: hypothetical protein GX568_03920 [Candidatus Gastranaerophilales bacterium]|jgi:hypothetical protein|nr:hypothetical protein [Candidatus Gastranaerophilales bacterium]